MVLAQEYLAQNPKAYQSLDLDKIKKRRLETLELLLPHSIQKLSQDLGEMGFLRSKHRDYRGEVVQLGKESELGPREHEQLLTFLRSLIPWRKGPFSFFGHRVDGEWASNMKWSRMEGAIGQLGQEVWADIGCNNEYYMYRLLQHKPDLIVGFDPMAKYLVHHSFYQKIYPIQSLAFELFGVEDLKLFPQFFHGILCMGVLYHRRDPLGALTDLYNALKPDGRLFMETIIIPGQEDYILFPQDRYLKSKGYWFLPMKKALLSMIRRCGFPKIEVLDITATTIEEQRKTPWIQSESLEDFLDPSQQGKTLEGLPAPSRIMIQATR